MTEILSRVPAQATLSCKCVCKTWRDLVSTQDFAKLHLSKSVPGLALNVYVEPSMMVKIIEITNELHVSTITELNFTHTGTASPYEWIDIGGSADGLLLLNILRRIDDEHELYLCNPITREYIDLCHPTKSSGYTIIYGFGVSKISGLYKVVGIEARYESWENECKVYTVGTGLWRSVAPPTQATYTLVDHGVFVNGSLHWFGRDSNDTLCISCFDLETELFNTFSPPPPLLQFENRHPNVFLAALEDSLCFCDCTSNDYTITIWLMKVDKSWTKEFAIQSEHYSLPTRLSKDEVILMDYESNSLLYYSCKNKTSQRICNFDRQACISVSYTPSLLSLESFGTENSIRWIGSFP
ncbi:hypothetical protein ACS0TY_036126 [Phlomoides rotata]